MQAMLAWGNRHFAPEGPSVVIMNRETGETADPVLIDRISGQPLSDPVFTVAPGPAATERVLKRLAAADRRLQSKAPTTPPPDRPRRSPNRQLDPGART